MSYTVTLTKKPGSAEANLFVGNRAGAGAALSDWQILQRDDDLKHYGIIFVVIESTDKRLFQPTLNIRYGENYAGSSTYPSTATLKASVVKTWIMEFIKNNKEVEEEVEKSVVKRSETTSTSSNKVEASSAPIETPTASWVKPTIAAGTLLSALLVGVGIAFASAPEEYDDDFDPPVFLVKDDEKPFTNWSKH